MKKIGIVTFYRAHNYGAFFQQYALQQYLLKQGFEADVVNYMSESVKNDLKFIMGTGSMIGRLGIVYTFFVHHKKWRERCSWRKKFGRCIDREIRISRRFSYEDARHFSAEYDCFIAGSDQVWNRDLTKEDDFYFLDFVEDPKKKLSYAASIGADGWRGANTPEVFADRLKDFGNILVREESAEKMLQEIGVEAKTVLDPTFLLRRESYEEFAGKSKFRLPEKYVLIYLAQIPTNLIRAASDYAKEHHCETILINSGIRDVWLENKKMDATVDIDPYDFMRILLHADMVFTTSYHGLVLSINLHKDFYYELAKSENNRNTRLEYIAKMLDLEARELKGTRLPENVQAQENAQLSESARQPEKEQLSESARQPEKEQLLESARLPENAKMRENTQLSGNAIDWEKTESKLSALIEQSQAELLNSLR